MFNLLGVGFGEVTVVHRTERTADQLAHNHIRTAHFALVLEFDFARDTRHGGVQVADARHNQRFPVQQGAAFRV